MRVPYQQLAAVLAEIRPRNDRARSWLQKLMLRCQNNARADLDNIAERASLAELQFDFRSLLACQGSDAKQKPLFLEVESLLKEIEELITNSRAKRASPKS